MVSATAGDLNILCLCTVSGSEGGEEGEKGEEEERGGGFWYLHCVRPSEGAREGGRNGQGMERGKKRGGRDRGRRKVLMIYQLPTCAWAPLLNTVPLSNIHTLQ